MYDNLVSYQTYANMKGVTQQAVRLWAEKGTIKTVSIDKRLFVVLTDEEVKQRKEANNGKTGQRYMGPY